MEKKKIILIALPIIILLVIVIFSLTPKKVNWTDSILNTDYEIYTLEADGTTKILDDSVLKEIGKYMNKLSNNGPFLGDINTFYKKVIIDYKTDIAVIEIINDEEVIIKESSEAEYYTYYTNAKKLVTYLNKQFNN